MIVDGGSTDGTKEYLESIKGEKTKIVMRESPKGQSNARNKGIAKSEGDYLLFLDDDDKLYGRGVEKMVDVLEHLPEDYAGVYAGEETFGEIEDFRCISAGKSKKVVDLSFGTSCTMFKSHIFDELEGFNEELETSEDLEFIIRLFSEGYSLYGIDDILYKRRVHKGQLTRNYEDVISANYSIIDMHEEKLSTKEIFERYHKISKLFIQIGKKSKASSNIQESKKLLVDKEDELDLIERLDRYEKISRLYIQIGENEKAFSTIDDSRKILEENISKLEDGDREHFFMEISNLYKSLEKNRRIEKGLVAMLELLTKYEEEFDEQYLLYRRLGLKFVELNEFRNARLCFKASVKRNSYDRFSYYYYFWSLFGRKGYESGRKIEEILK